MTPAERRGYQQICGDNGAILTIACDQRGGIRKILAPDAEGQKKITDHQLGDVKTDVVSHLASHAPSVLLDSVCAVPRVVEEGALKRTTALLIGLDASGYDEDEHGHWKSRLTKGLTARRVRELGGTGGKIMVYLRSDHPAANAHNLDILKRCVADFAAEDLLLVVEFLTYPARGEEPAAYKAKTQELVEGGTHLCLEAGAKVLKIPYPGSREACEAVTKIAGKVPWAVLSAGVDHAAFLPQVKIAMDAGASGVIAGRSLWKDCVFLDRERTREALVAKALPRLKEIQAVLDRHPRPVAAR
jgi:tagatose-1,6-bisphosphate aldolase